MNKSRSLYLWNRQLHLYLGLFICPFILLFAISTIFLNHSLRNKETPLLSKFNCRKTQNQKSDWTAYFNNSI